jgi:hypothetical protein
MRDPGDENLRVEWVSPVSLELDDEFLHRSNSYKWVERPRDAKRLMLRDAIPLVSVVPDTADACRTSCLDTRWLAASQAIAAGRRVAVTVVICRLTRRVFERVE